ncbi:MAG TPA: flagellar assembly protein FliH [Halomonas sp.]|nr:flagellar assembly protein FliH [Halomonas sp.]
MSDRRQPLRPAAHTPWRRWEMGELEAPHQPQRSDSEATAHDAFRRRAELKALREQTLREARTAGHREGYAAGHAEGLEAGQKEGREEGRRQAEAELEQRARTLLEPLASLAETFSAALDDLDEALAEDLVALALETGRQLAGEALKARPQQVLETVRGLLHTEPPLIGQQRLWLHPLDAKLVEKHLGRELAAAGWTLQPDAQLNRGGCRVTGASGELDATWEARWAAVMAQVRRRQHPRDHSTGEQSSDAPHDAQHTETEEPCE